MKAKYLFTMKMPSMSFVLVCAVGVSAGWAMKSSLNRIMAGQDALERDFLEPSIEHNWSEWKKQQATRQPQQTKPTVHMSGGGVVPVTPAGGEAWPVD